jgi:adenylylsulfate kinase
MIIQLCGLSGAGKSTLAQEARVKLEAKNIPVEIIDGDDYRRHICKDLGFSREDRMENIRRLGFIADKFSRHGIVAIICAINPYEEVRAELRSSYRDVLTVYVKCSLEELMRRDTKGLYRRAMLPDGHNDKLRNLSGVGDPFDVPAEADLEIDTAHESVSDSTQKLVDLVSAAFAKASKA